MTRRLVLTLLLVALGSSVTAVAAPAGRPNVLIAIADDWSFPHATAYGTGWVRTPAFDRVAREGVLFLNAYTPVAKCSASRASLLTGRNPWQLGAGFTHWSYFPPEVPTVTETLGVSVGDLLRWAMVGVLALVALFAVIRPMMRTALGGVGPGPALVTAGTAGVAVPALAGGRTVAELEGEMQAAIEARREPGRAASATKSIAARVDSQPEHVAQLVRAMMAQEEK